MTATNHAQLAILRLLHAKNIPLTGEGLVMRDGNLKISSVYVHLGHLEAQGEVARVPGFMYAITPKGLQRLSNQPVSTQ